MTNVIHLLSSGGYSGAENVAISIINHSPKEVKSVYASPGGVIESRLEDELISHLCIEGMSLIAIRKTLRTNNVDIIYAHDFKASIKASLLFLGKPVISHIHQNPTWFRNVNFKTFLYFLCSMFISKIVFVSEETLDEFVFRKAIQNKATVLHNYVDASRVIQLSDEGDGKNYDFCYLGRLDYVKQPLLFLDIIRVVKKTYPHVNAVMIGDGQQRKEVEAYIEINDMKENITILGFLSNPYIYVKNSKALVIPSQWEGFGMSAVEAMVLGVPVIVANVGGLKTVVTEESGFKCNELSDYVFACSEILSDSSLQKKLSEGAVVNSKRYTNKATWELGIGNILDFRK